MVKPPRLSPSALTQAVSEILEAGVPVICFLKLSQENAKDYEKIIDTQGKYVTETRGPSLEYDPLKQQECYALFVRKPLTKSMFFRA